MQLGVSEEVVEVVEAVEVVGAEVDMVQVEVARAKVGAAGIRTKVDEEDTKPEMAEEVEDVEVVEVMEVVVEDTAIRDKVIRVAPNQPHFHPTTKHSHHL